MFKRLMRTTWSLLVVLGLIGLVPASTVAAQTSAAACEQEYTVQAGDWLSRIAAETYGDQTAYPAIVEATNAQTTDNDFANIDDPDVIEVGWTLCLPAESEAMDTMDQTGQMEQTQQQATELTAPEDEMLMVVQNLTKANAPSTFTISGGEYGGGEEITVDAGERLELNLEPGDYRVIWSSPATDDISFGRDFTAVAGTVARARIIPEKEQVAFRFNLHQDQMEQMTETAEAANQIDREFPFEAPSGRGMLVVGNRSLADIPSTLTITGGRFGGGEQISVDPGEEIFLPVDPGEFTVQWSAPIDQPGQETGETVIVSRQVELSAGETPLWWIVPEEFRAFSQTEGEVPSEIVP